MLLSREYRLLGQLEKKQIAEAEETISTILAGYTREEAIEAGLETLDNIRTDIASLPSSPTMQEIKDITYLLREYIETGL